jgi:hypothetical protein
VTQKQFRLLTTWYGQARAIGFTREQAIKIALLKVLYEFYPDYCL